MSGPPDEGRGPVAAGTPSSDLAAAKQADPPHRSEPRTAAVPIPEDRDGRERAERNTDPFWRDGAMHAVEMIAATDSVFEAYDLVDFYGVPEPDHPNRWGPLFTAAARAGVIVKATPVVARRPSRAGSLCWSWRGTRRHRDQARRRGGDL